VSTITSLGQEMLHSTQIHSIVIQLWWWLFPVSVRHKCQSSLIYNDQ